MKPDWMDVCGTQIVAWVRKSYPDEGCGLIVQTADSFRVIETTNLADKYHSVDPQMYPRTARTFYIINPMEFIDAQERGEQVVAVVHSHADVGDYFSDEDIAGALMPCFEPDEVGGRGAGPKKQELEPTHPGVDYLVVSVREQGADAASLFRFRDGGFPLVGRYRIEEGEIKENISPKSV